LRLCGSCRRPRLRQLRWRKYLCVVSAIESRRCRNQSLYVFTSFSRFLVTRYDSLPLFMRKGISVIVLSRSSSDLPIKNKGVGPQLPEPSLCSNFHPNHRSRLPFGAPSKPLASHVLHIMRLNILHGACSSWPSIAASTHTATWSSFMSIAALNAFLATTRPQLLHTTILFSVYQDLLKVVRLHVGTRPRRAS
jgi:hypothetical protein